MNKHVEFLVKVRDLSLQMADAYNEYIDSFAPPEIQLKSSVVDEANFDLKYEPQQGAKLGEYEIAQKQNNLEDKWCSAYNILRVNNSTIKDRYHGQDYQYSYWLYGEDRIFRQKLKPKPPKT